MIIFKKISRGLKFVWEFVVLRNIYELSYRLNLPKISALILVLLTKRLNDKKKYRVLCLGRSQFVDDVGALIIYSNKIQYLYFHKILLGKIVRHMIPFSFDPTVVPGYIKGDKNAEVYGEDDGITYHIDPKYDKGKQKVYNYMSKMFPLLKKLLKFDAVMSGNYIYVDQQEFFSVCEKNIIPAIILNKEGFGSYYDKDLDYLGLTEKGCRFIGSKMLFVNDHVKQYEIKHLTGFEEKKATTVGIPRYDYYKNPIKHLKQIVFFGFVADEYFTNWLEIRDDIKIVNQINDIIERYYENAIRFAVEHPEYRVIIKLKNPAPRYKEIPIKVLNKFKRTRISNLEIRSQLKTEKLILDSQIILGYNCSVLIEALIVNKTIISPDFGGLSYRDYFINNPNLVIYTNEYDEIENICINYKDYTITDDKEKREFLENLIFKVDGKSSQRAENAIIETIEERKRKTFN